MTGFTNRMVEENPELREVALRYLKEYKGDFYVLLDMLDRLDSGTPLTTTMVRTVLNCMLADPCVVNLTVPSGSRVFDAGFEPDPDRSLVPPERKVRRRKLKDRVPVRLQARFKLNYIYSTWQRADTLHILDPRKSTVTWIPDRSFFEFHVRAYCKGWWNRKSWDQYYLDARRNGYAVRGLADYLVCIDEDEAEKLISEGGRRWCPQCVSLKERAR